jgi:lipid-A-disaccharide synthase
MFTIFPFETDFYKKYDYPVHFVGNPTVDELAIRPNKDETFEQFIERNNLPDKKIIALLAGSRKQEISMLLPIMAEVAERFGEYQFIIAGAPSQLADFYKTALGKKQIPVIFNQTYELLQQSTAALVASGTATLEAAIINIPQVVCYKIEFGKFGKWLVRDVIMNVSYISLVNLILNREAVRELFQEKCNVETISVELDRLLNDKLYRDKMFDDYIEIKSNLGGEGCANRAACKMIELLSIKQ